MKYTYYVIAHFSDKTMVAVSYKRDANVSVKLKMKIVVLQGLQTLRKNNQFWYKTVLLMQF